MFQLYCIDLNYGTLNGINECYESYNSFSKMYCTHSIQFFLSEWIAFADQIQITNTSILGKLLTGVVGSFQSDENLIT